MNKKKNNHNVPRHLWNFSCLNIGACLKIGQSISSTDLNSILKHIGACLKIGQSLSSTDLNWILNSLSRTRGSLFLSVCTHLFSSACAQVYFRSHACAQVQNWIKTILLKDQTLLLIFKQAPVASHRAVIKYTEISGTGTQSCNKI